MPIRMSPARLARVQAARRHCLEIVRAKGRPAVDGWVSATAGDFNIMHRTPFTKPMPEGRQTPTYLHALLKQRAAPDLPYSMEVWYLNTKIMNVQWDAEDKIQLISFHPGAWEEKLTAALPSPQKAPS